MTLNFWRMCTANLLLFISVYMLFPLLPFVMGEQLGVSVGQAGSMFLVFVVAQAQAFRRMRRTIETWERLLEGLDQK